MTRYEKLQAFGCVCCRILGHKNTQVDIHHLVEGKKRLGDDYTIPLCAFHHRGIIPLPPENAPKGWLSQWGPSRHYHGRRAFEKHWGTERELLEYVNTHF